MPKGPTQLMTFKAKPVVKRAQRSSWDGQERRNFYLNIGFGVVTIAAVVILLIAAGLSWYNEHLVSVGSVNGQSISKDEYNDRLAIESWRLDQVEQQPELAGAEHAVYRVHDQWSRRTHLEGDPNHPLRFGEVCRIEIGVGVFAAAQFLQKPGVGKRVGLVEVPAA